MKLGERLDAVAATDLTGPRKWVLFWLARRANDNNGQCWTSLKRLSGDVGISTRAASDAIRYLTEHGYIHPRRSYRRATRYSVVFAPLKQALRVARDASHHSTRRLQNPSLNPGDTMEEERHTNPGWCRDCGHYYETRPYDDLCAKCGGRRIEQEHQHQLHHDA